MELKKKKIMSLYWNATGLSEEIVSAIRTSVQSIRKWLLLEIMNVVSFQVLTATRVKMAVFWDAASRSLVYNDGRFRGPYFVYHQ
jgi:hypothetical protein